MSNERISVNDKHKTYIFDVGDARWFHNTGGDFWPWRYLHLHVSCPEAGVDDYLKFSLPILVNFRLYRRYNKLIRQAHKRKRSLSHILQQFEIHI